MMKLLVISLGLVGGLLFQSDVFTQTVFERKGNIFYRARDGSERQITSSGKDFSPSLAADGMEIVFARRVREADGVVSDDPGASELWITELSDVGSSKALLTGSVSVRGINFDFFSSPRFSPGKEFVYFEIPYSSTSAGIVRLTRATGETEFIASAINFTVLYSGNWKGYIVALQRQAVFAQDPGVDNWYWLLNSSGERVGYIGKSDDELQRFLAEQTK